MKGTLETLDNAGIKVWMLTGDKVETATCIAISARLSLHNSFYLLFRRDLWQRNIRLVSRTTGFFTLSVQSKEDAWRQVLSYTLYYSPIHQRFYHTHLKRNIYFQRHSKTWS